MDDVVAFEDVRDVLGALTALIELAFGAAKTARHVVLLKQILVDPLSVLALEVVAVGRLNDR